MSDLGKSLLQGAKEALDYANGKKNGAKVTRVKVPASIDVREIRDRLHMSRKAFADTYGFSIRTLEKWERGERLPEGAARLYLTVIEKMPKEVRKAIS